MGQCLARLCCAAYDAMSRPSAHSGSISRGEHLQGFDFNGEYWDGDCDEPFWDRIRQIDTNLSNLCFKLRKQAFHEFKDQIVKPELSIGKANMEGNTALHLAVQNGHEMTAHYLIRREPHTSFSLNKEGISPLYLAIEARFPDLIQCILSKISSTNYLDQMSPKKSVLLAAIRAQNNGNFLLPFIY
ncbi:hypothetical protein Ancab_039564 [Ancistrocladus abbreviatus]